MSRVTETADFLISRNHKNEQRQNHLSRRAFGTLDALAQSLRSEIAAARSSVVSQCITIEMCLSLECLVPLRRPVLGPYAEGGSSDLPPQFRTSTISDSGSLISHPIPEATVYTVVSVLDSHGRQIVQRAASRGILAALEAVDGYRYCFNNAWAAKDDEGCRFSYTCQDSTQNKDRHANGYTRTVKHMKGDGERGFRKPTYDCKGSISVKFSSSKQSIDISYRHYAIHSTAAEMKQLPGCLPHSHSLADQDEDPFPRTDGLTTVLQTEHSTSTDINLANRKSSNTSSLAPGSRATNVSKSSKRKRDWHTSSATWPQNVSSNDQMSLMELLHNSENANLPAPETNMLDDTDSDRASVPPPVKYELPPWQAAHASACSNARQRMLPQPRPYNATNNVPSLHHARPVAEHPAVAPSSQQLSTARPLAQGLFTTMKPSAKKFGL